MKSLDEAKHQIKTITVTTDYRLFRDRWLNIKRILDAIYKELSPLIGDQQTISINKDSLPIEQEKLFQSVLEKMLEDGIVDYYNRNNEMQVVTTSDQIRKFLKGENIIVKNRNIFENYRKEISEFYDFIEKDGKERFPKVYKKENTNIEHSQKNNAIVNATTLKNKIFWYIICPLFVVILGGMILEWFSVYYFMLK